MIGPDRLEKFLNQMLEFLPRSFNAWIHVITLTLKTLEPGKGVLRGDWGISLVNRQPVTKVIGERLANTLLLMVTAEVIIILEH